MKRIAFLFGDTTSALRLRGIINLVKLLPKGLPVLGNNSHCDEKS